VLTPREVMLIDYVIFLISTSHPTVLQEIDGLENCKFVLHTEEIKILSLVAALYNRIDYRRCHINVYQISIQEYNHEIIIGGYIYIYIYKLWIYTKVSFM